MKCNCLQKGRVCAGQVCIRGQCATPTQAAALWKKCRRPRQNSRSRGKTFIFPAEFAGFLCRTMPLRPWRKRKDRGLALQGKGLQWCGREPASSERRLPHRRYRSVHFAGCAAPVLRDDPRRDRTLAAATKRYTVFRGLAAHTRPAACKARNSSSANRRERSRKRTPSPFSSENMPPRPATTSMMSWVCFQ